jgi:hypothetical protein
MEVTEVCQLYLNKNGKITHLLRPDQFISKDIAWKAQDIGKIHLSRSY